MKRVNKQSSFTTADTATCYQRVPQEYWAASLNILVPRVLVGSGISSRNRTGSDPSLRDQSILQHRLGHRHRDQHRNCDHSCWGISC